MAETCGAFNKKQCRATKNLTRCVIRLKGAEMGMLETPEQIVVPLCPKHFKLKVASQLRRGQVSNG